MNDQQARHGESAKFRVVVDDRSLSLPEPVWTGRQLLELTDHRPTEEFLLYQLGDHNLMEDIGLDESVDVRKPGVERFVTFRSDRSFRFLLNDQRQDWGAPKISEANLRRLIRHLLEMRRVNQGAEIADVPHAGAGLERQDAGCDDEQAGSHDAKSARTPPLMEELEKYGLNRGPVRSRR